MPEERKLVTILFADVTGSTALGDILDPEDVRALMSRYYTHARRVVTEHGGTLEKFIGDAVMAVFGLTLAHSDDAERGLAAALALHAAIASDSILASSFQLRIGVNTGEVVATSEADRDDFLITGDAVNVAARLQQHAAPGETLVGERTMYASNTAFLFAEQRIIEVKGKRQPLHVFPLSGPRQTRQVVRPVLVGRSADLLQLSVLQTRVLQEHISQLISIIAPAGTGKSRLLEEFLNSLNPADGFQIATVRSLPYGQTLTYWPLRTLLTSFVGEEITRMRVIDLFRQGGHDPERAIHLADSVLTGLGIQKESHIDREDIFDGWRLLIEIVARQAPRIIVFEDLHWASESLLDLVTYILNMPIQAPILFITLSRPELLDRCPRWGGGRQNFSSLTLQPLTSTQTYTLIQQLMPRISTETCDILVERSGGNPFFAIELVHSICERPECDAPVTGSMLPDTVHAVVQARLDQLSALERTVVQVASIPLRSFRRDMLLALMEGTNQQEIDRALAGLLARDFIVSKGGEAGTYTFRHILINNVAYGTLARAERIRLHSKLATWLEKTTGGCDDSAELLAYHFYEAVRLARQSAIPIALPIEPARAIRYLKCAGELAAHIGNFSEARTYLQNAIDIAPQQDLLTLYEALGDSGPFWNVATVEAYHKALSQWRNDSAHDPLTGARLIRKLLICYTRGGVCLKTQSLQAEFERLSKEAHQLAEAAGDEYEQRRLHVADLFANRFIRVENAETKRQMGLEAAEYFQHIGDWSAYSEALDSYASISGVIGANMDMLAASQRRLLVPDLSASERRDALIMIVKAYISLNDVEGCIKVIEQELAQGRAHSLGDSLSCAMYAAYLGGRWSKVKEFAAPLLQAWERLQSDDPCGGLDGYLALFHIARAQEDEAAMDVATAILKQIYPDESQPERVLLEALFADDPHRLQQHAHDLFDICLWEMLLLYNEHGIPLPPLSLPEKDSHMLRGNDPYWILALNRALADGDIIKLEQAIEKAEASQRIVHAARMRIILAQLSGDSTHLDRARLVLEQLGDRRSLCKLEEVCAALANC
ncbi:adenylate/guanylate cyclase domain-containing protein [Ktedonosporobacter rubrisoli]|uniref:Adenylate/guanylate cyclase domain-containing protein n=1 Tax=Ktedonosporobacter rubrisoli TaxID=2509675 RepID=A0A4P6JI46_KTERU|nr:adenylate/guanylate cyclase domain-containing protein [Ktedonosporobacter rubrisoli]QBD74725.1 adenylate/guanylate cyclase domain-containing protein [Ktedonosporobacter rubrisoli]